MFYHFLLGNGRGGFPSEVFLGVIFELPAGTIRESMVTLADLIKLSRDRCSSLSGT